MVTDPLSKNSKIEVYNPSIEFFLSRIRNKQYFSYSKLNHGFWDVILGVMIVHPELRKIKKDKKYFEDFSQAMADVLASISTIRMQPKMYFDVLNILNTMDQKPLNFFHGVSDLDFYPHEKPPHSVNSYIPTFNTFKRLPISSTLRCRELRCGDRQLIIKHFLPENFIPFNGILWRSYGYNGLLQDFFNEVKKDHHVIIVGPEYYKNFGELLNIDSFDHIGINQFKASANRDELLSKILEHNKRLQNEDAIYLFVASSLSLWLINQLHSKVSNSYLIDVGQALDMAIPADKMKTTSEFQILGYGKGKDFKSYKTAHPSYFVEKENGDRIEVNKNKEVVFLDEPRNSILCWVSSTSVKTMYYLYHKMKAYRYGNSLIMKFSLQVKNRFNYLFKS